MGRKRGRKGKEYVTETTCGPTKSKIFTIFSFTGKLCQPLSSHRMRCGQRHAYREEEWTRNRNTEKRAAALSPVRHQRLLWGQWKCVL